MNMKRKTGRKSQKRGEIGSNGVEEDPKDQNSDISDFEDDQPTEKKRRSAKASSRNAPKRVEAFESGNSDAGLSDEDNKPIKHKESKEKKKKKVGDKKGRKSAAKDDQGDEDNETQRKSGRKSKKDESNSNGVEESLKENDDTSENEEDQATNNKKKSTKTSSRNSSKRTVASKSENSDAESSDEDNKPTEHNESKELKQKKGSKKGRKSAAEEEQEDQGDEDEDNETEYEVQAVLDEKKIGGIRHYLIRWKGYEEESDTWEPEGTVDCKELIEEYKEKKRKTKGKKKHKKEKTEDKEQDWDENENFEVDRILEVHFRKDGKREFLVSWKGYGRADNSWEPEENMDCKDLIEKFMSKVDKAREIDERELRVNRKQVQRFTLSTQEYSRRLSRRFRGKERVQYHDAE